MKKIMSSFIISGLYLSSSCFGMDTVSRVEKFNFPNLSGIKGMVKSIEKKPVIRRVKRKVRKIKKAIKNDRRIQLALGASAAIASGALAYHYLGRNSATDIISGSVNSETTSFPDILKNAFSYSDLETHFIPGVQKNVTYPSAFSDLETHFIPGVQKNITYPSAISCMNYQWTPWSKPIVECFDKPGTWSETWAGVKMSLGAIAEVCPFLLSFPVLAFISLPLIYPLAEKLADLMDLISPFNSKEETKISLKINDKSISVVDRNKLRKEEKRIFLDAKNVIELMGHPNATENSDNIENLRKDLLDEISELKEIPTVIHEQICKIQPELVDSVNIKGKRIPIVYRSKLSREEKIILLHAETVVRRLHDDAEENSEDIKNLTEDLLNKISKSNIIPYVYYELLYNSARNSGDIVNRTEDLLNKISKLDVIPNAIYKLIYEIYPELSVTINGESIPVVDRDKLSKEEERISLDAKDVIERLERADAAENFEDIENRKEKLFNDISKLGVIPNAICKQVDEIRSKTGNGKTILNQVEDFDLKQAELKQMLEDVKSLRSKRIGKDPLENFEGIIASVLERIKKINPDELQKVDDVQESLGNLFANVKEDFVEALKKYYSNKRNSINNEIKDLIRNVKKANQQELNGIKGDYKKLSQKREKLVEDLNKLSEFASNKQKEDINKVINGGANKINQLNQAIETRSDELNKIIEEQFKSKKAELDNMFESVKLLRNIQINKNTRGKFRNDAALVLEKIKNINSDELKKVDDKQGSLGNLFANVKEDFVEALKKYYSNKRNSINNEIKDLIRNVKKANQQELNGIKGDYKKLSQKREKLVEDLNKLSEFASNKQKEDINKVINGGANKINQLGQKIEERSSELNKEELFKSKKAELDQMLKEVESLSRTKTNKDTRNKFRNDAALVLEKIKNINSDELKKVDDKQGSLVALYANVEEDFFEALRNSINQQKEDFVEASKKYDSNLRNSINNEIKDLIRNVKKANQQELNGIKGDYKKLSQKREKLVEDLNRLSKLASNKQKEDINKIINGGANKIEQLEQAIEARSSELNKIEELDKEKSIRNEIADLRKRIKEEPNVDNLKLEEWDNRRLSIFKKIKDLTDKERRGVLRNSWFNMYSDLTAAQRRFEEYRSDPHLVTLKKLREFQKQLEKLGKLEEFQKQLKDPQEEEIGDQNKKINDVSRFVFDGKFFLPKSTLSSPELSGGTVVIDNFSRTRSYTD